MPTDKDLESIQLVRLVLESRMEGFGLLVEEYRYRVADRILDLIINSGQKVTRQSIENTWTTLRRRASLLRKSGKEWSNISALELMLQTIEFLENGVGARSI